MSCQTQPSDVAENWGNAFRTQTASLAQHRLPHPMLPARILISRLGRGNRLALAQEAWRPTSHPPYCTIPIWSTWRCFFFSLFFCFFCSSFLLLFLPNETGNKPGSSNGENHIARKLPALERHETRKARKGSRLAGSLHPSSSSDVVASSRRKAKNLCGNGLHGCLGLTLVACCFYDASPADSDAAASEKGGIISNTQRPDGALETAGYRRAPWTRPDQDPCRCGKHDGRNGHFPAA